MGIRIINKLTFAITCLALALTSSAQDTSSLRASPIDEQLNELERFGYRPDQRVSSQEREQAVELITRYANADTINECDFSRDIRHNGTFSNIGQYDQVISDMTPFILQNYSEECVANLLTHYLAEKYRNPLEPQSLQVCRAPENSPGVISFGTGYPDIVCPEVVAARGLFLETSSRLSEALFNPTNELRVCRIPMGGDAIDLENFSQDVAAIIDSRDQIQECTEPRINETLLRNNRAYSLTKTGPSDYTVNLAINFSLMNGGSSSQSSEDMLQKMRSCLEAANSFFKSPSGEQISFNILSASQVEAMENDERPVVHQIRYQNAEFREHSTAYRDTSDCLTMSHEIFHLLGLQDEYHEGGEGFYFRNDGLTVDEGSTEFIDSFNNGTLNFVPVNNSCRSIPTSPSIMAQDREAWKRVASTSVNCRCDGYNAELCRKILSLENENITKLYAAKFDFPDFQQLCQFSPYDSTIYRSNLASNSTNLDLNSMTDSEMNQIMPVQTLSSTPSEVRMVITKTPSLRIIPYSGGELSDEFNQVMPEVFVCSCEGKAIENCEQKLRQLSQDDPSQYYSYQCSEHRGMVSNQSSNFESSFPRVVEQTSVSQNQDTFRITPKTPDTGASLLQPAHMSFIKFSGCQSRAVKYRTCQSFSTVNECPDRPAYCDEEEQWLMQEQ